MFQPMTCSPNKVRSHAFIKNFHYLIYDQGLLDLSRKAISILSVSMVEEID